MLSNVSHNKYHLCVNQDDNGDLNLISFKSLHEKGVIWDIIPYDEMDEEDAQECKDLAYLHYFHLPEEYKNQFYSFDYSGVRFVVLGVDDSQLKLSTYLPDGKKFDEERLRK